MEMEKHVTIVGVLHIVFGVIGLCIGAIIFVAVTGGGLLSGDREAMAITSIVGTAIGGFFAICSLPSLIGGIFLLKRVNWARILVLIVSVLDILNVPIGTAVGVYSLWVLLNDDATKLFT